MITKPGYILLIMIVLIHNANDLSSQDLTLDGLIAGWAVTGKSDDWAFQSGMRYIPGLKFDLPLLGKYTVEGELSANLTGSYTVPVDGDKFYGKLKPYRMWMKFSGNQFELRAGLQKINFGAATMLRPLMWFDRIDPRDPLQLTDGVYGLLGRYYTLNNINIWLWGLYGNSGTKGWEFTESTPERVEIGGRLQLPFPRGEIALSYHNRQANLPVAISGLASDIEFVENRLGVDVKADLGIGVWMESQVIKQDHGWENPYTRMVTLGFDYTFDIGNGLHLVSEFFNYTSSSSLTSKGEGITMTGINASYPVSIITNISAILFYDFTNKGLYRFINWGMAYDKFSIYIMAFWNPDQFRIFDYSGGSNLFNGAGMQLMAVYNY